MNRWIVSRHRYHQHETLDAAQAEKKRLEAATRKGFRIYRVKTTIEPDEGEKQGDAG